MLKLRRSSKINRTHIMTVMTRDQNPILLDHPGIFLDAWFTMAQKSEGILRAWAILPEHFHAIVDPGTNDLSGILERFNTRYMYRYFELSGIANGPLWQPRYLSREIRNDADYGHCLNYVHLNAVRHGLVSAPSHWQWSSFGDYVAAGMYPEDWCDYEENDGAGSEQGENGETGVKS